MPYNIPLLTIPLYYILAVYPHGHAAMVASKGQPSQMDNSNPNGSSHLEKLKRRLTEREFAAFERGESCHRNHLENMPLFVAAVFAGLLAETQQPEYESGNGSAVDVGLTRFCVGWMVIRTLYTINYVVTESQQWSYVRSALYFAGTGWAFYVIGKSASVLGS